jgi:glycolate oxidase iron-sulfur subunit
MEETRAAIRATPPEPQTVVRHAVEWLGYRVVLPYHAVLMALTWVLLVGQRLHLVPKRFGLPKLRAASLRAPLRSDPSPDVILFTGCVMDAWQRDVHRAAALVLRATGARVGVPGRGADCCGALHTHAGRRDEAERLARRAIASMPGDAPIAVDSAGCGAALKEYGKLLGTPEAVAFSNRVRDVTELVVERGVPPLRTVPGTTVVVQDPCHLRHVQKMHGPVRTALRAAYDLAEPDDEGLCCGAGGTYSIAQPELSTAIRDRKVEALRRAASGRRFVVASANPGCAMHLAAAGLPVKHPVELLAEALQ